MKKWKKYPRPGGSGPSGAEATGPPKDKDRVQAKLRVGALPARAFIQAMGILSTPPPRPCPEGGGWSGRGSSQGFMGTKKSSRRRGGVPLTTPPPPKMVGGGVEWQGVLLSNVYDSWPRENPRQGPPEGERVGETDSLQDPWDPRDLPDRQSALVQPDAFCCRRRMDPLFPLVVKQGPVPSG